eukprot:2796418-Pleurochrysis_carterae.AAC.1
MRRYTLAPPKGVRVFTALRRRLRRSSRAIGVWPIPVFPCRGRTNRTHGRARKTRLATNENTRVDERLYILRSCIRGRKPPAPDAIPGPGGRPLRSFDRDAVARCCRLRCAKGGATHRATRSWGACARGRELSGCAYRVAQT